MENDMAKLLIQLEETREQAKTARRLACGLRPTEAAVEHLRVYAGELEAELEKLEAQAAILKQAANGNQLEQPIAALKVPSDPEAEG